MTSGTGNRAPMYLYDAQPLLVSVEQARDALRLSATDASTARALDLQMRVCSDAIRNYLKSANNPTWDETSAPPVVQAAVLHRLVGTWMHRGDDETHVSNYHEMNWQEVERILKQVRDPALA